MHPESTVQADLERYGAGERDHHAVAAFVKTLRVVSGAEHLEPLHHELFFSSAHAGPNGELSMILFKTRYGSPDEQGVRLVELTAEPTPDGLVYRVWNNTFVPRPEPRPALDASYLRTAPSSRNYRIAVKPTGDHKS